MAHDGERYQVNGFLDVADAPAPPVLLGVLREQMAQLAGGHADGALCWLGPAEYLRDGGGAEPGRWSEAADREKPPLIAELPCALTTDLDAVREMAASDLAIYPQVPFYRAMFEAAGVAVRVGTGPTTCSRRPSLFGDEDGLAKKIDALFDAGADEVALSPFGVGPILSASQQDCIRVLSDIVKGR